MPLPEPVLRTWHLAFYPRVQPRLTPLTAHLPVPTLDLLLAGLLCALLVLVWRRGLRMQAVLAWGRDAVGAGAAAWLVFLLMWGWHYQVPTLETRVGADRASLTPHRARAVASYAVEVLNVSHARAHADPWPAWPALVATTEPLVRSVLPEVGVAWEPALPRPRYSIVDRYFRWAGIDGMTNPFGLDVVVNSRLLDVERPAVLAHEWAHLAGFADESDASFVAWMACVRGGAQHRYSAWLAVFAHVLTAIPPGERRAVVDALADGPRQDFAAIAARSAADRLPSVSLMAWRVYDQFLKVNRVDEGIARYDAVARLILAAADETTGELRRPVRSSDYVPER